MRLTFSILGPMRLWADHDLVSLGPRQRAVLAALLLRPNQPMTVARLLERVWERPTAAGPSNLRTYVAAIRQAVGRDRLPNDPSGGYRLVVHPGELDSTEFEQGVRAGLGLADAAARADRLAEALRLWRGGLLDGLALSPALLADAAHLEELRLAAAEQLAQARLACGDPGPVVPLMRSLTGEHPYRETLWAALILALHRSGRAAEALAAYGQMRTLLREGTGMDPGRRLRLLQERILADDPTLEAESLL